MSDVFYIADEYNFDIGLVYTRPGLVSASTVV